jgi:hypothetical protein
MSDVLLSYRGRQIREADVVFLRDLIASNPRLSRHALSINVCQAWKWVQPNGQLRDQVCRSLMLVLHRAGHIPLPAPRIKAVNNAILHRRVAQLEFCDTTPIEGSLASLGALEIRLVRRSEGESLFNYLLNAPWVKVPHLASHLLGRITRRISADWQALYHHPIVLLESFVDTQRFNGTCYRAANWICVGRSVGRGTKAKTQQKTTSIKELHVYPLGKDFRQRLAQ